MLTLPQLILSGKDILTLVLQKITAEEVKLNEASVCHKHPAEIMRKMTQHEN